MKSTKSKKKSSPRSRILPLLLLAVLVFAAAGIFMLSRSSSGEQASAISAEDTGQAGQSSTVSSADEGQSSTISAEGDGPEISGQQGSAVSGSDGQTYGSPDSYQDFPAAAPGESDSPAGSDSFPGTSQAGTGTSSAGATSPTGTFPAVTLRAEPLEETALTADLSEVPAYSNSPWTEVNENRPFFSDGLIREASAGKRPVSFEYYGDLDALGRCTYAFACIGKDLMPTGKRESISGIRPTGWQFTKYAGIDGNYLYNRCHLIAYGLTAENANDRNLITGTRYMNTAGMNSFENKVINYIRETGNHVLYRVTPVFEKDNLVASGVLMEAQSLEDKEILFCIFAYNVQPGISIDYMTGQSSGGRAFTGSDSSRPSTGTDSGDGLASAGANSGWSISGTAGAGNPASGARDPANRTENPAGTSGNSRTSGGAKDPAVPSENGAATSRQDDRFIPPAEEVTYVLNVRSGKFHRPSCSSVRDMAQKNREDVTESRDELIRKGFTPCGACKP